MNLRGPCKINVFASKPRDFSFLSYADPGLPSWATIIRPPEADSLSEDVEGPDLSKLACWGHVQMTNKSRSLDFARDDQSSSERATYFHSLRWAAGP